MKHSAHAINEATMPANTGVADDRSSDVISC